MPLLADLVRIIQPGEALGFEIQRTDDELVLLVQPRLKAPVADTATGDEAAQLRAALATPLRITGDAETLDAELPVKLREYAQARAALGEKVDALDALREAAKAADRLAEKERQKQAKAGKKPAAQSPSSAADGDVQPQAAPAGEGAKTPPLAEQGATGSLFD
jgi:PRTRC genetic system protein E